MIIQFKPYLAFFAVYYLCPVFSSKQKDLIKKIILIISFFMFLIGCASLVYPLAFRVTVGHVAYFAAIITASSLLYYYCSEGAKIDKMIFILILAIGLFSARSKFYGFFIISLVTVIFFGNISRLKLNFKTIAIAVLSLAAMVLASWKKMVMYFGVGKSLDSVPEEFMARAMLYVTSFEIFKDFFPFGSGFASFASHSSGVYYSPLYAKYGIENVKGISKNNYSYIADTYYPCLAQFGIIGVFLYILFFAYIIRKAYKLFLSTQKEKYFIIPFLIIGYLLIANALIQKQGRTDVDYSTVFFFNIFIGIAMYLLLFSTAPFIASFYSQPQLETIIKFVGLNLILTSFCAVQRAQLTISLDFKKQAIISFSTVAISGGIGIWLAYHGYAVWTLVIQSLLTNLLALILLWGSTRWIPRLCFSKESFKELFGFGSKLLAGGLLHTIYLNLYSLVIGKYFSSADLGNFNRATSLAQYVSVNITSIITRVTYPIECQIQHDNEELQRKFFMFIRMTAFIIFPLMIGLCVLADPLIRVILTDKWVHTIPYLQILSIAYMWDPISRLNWDLLNVKRRSDYSLRSEIIKKLIAVTILVITIPFGITIMCAGIAAYALCDIYVLTRFTKRLLPDVYLRKELKALCPILLLSISMGLIIYICVSFIPILLFKLIVGIIIGICYYLTLSYLLKWEEIDFILSLILKKHRQ